MSVHAQIEEEIFYPAVKAALKDKLLVPEATVEHGGIKDLVAQLEGLEGEGEMYDAKVKVLSEYVEHHVKEDQNEMFPKVKATSIDLVELGARMAARKAELLAARGSTKADLPIPCGTARPTSVGRESLNAVRCLPRVAAAINH